MRRIARTDSNQAEIVAALRQIGCSVQPLHTVGKGCPDLLVGIRSRNFLMEIKYGKKAPSARKLTEDEDLWHQCWRGHVVIIESVDQALNFISAAFGISHKNQRLLFEKSSPEEMGAA